MLRSFPAFASLLLISAIAAGVSPAAEPQAASASQNNASTPKSSQDGWIDLFDGKTLQGWHVSPNTGHSRPSKNTSGGRWVACTDGMGGTPGERDEIPRKSTKRSGVDSEILRLARDLAAPAHGAEGRVEGRLTRRP